MKNPVRRVGRIGIRYPSITAARRRVNVPTRIPWRFEARNAMIYN